MSGEDKYPTFTALLVALGFPPTREYRFCQRLWRFDYSWPDVKLALEVDGGVYAGGRHTRGAGYEADCEKLAEAVLMGWRVIRCTPGQIERGQALRWIQRAMGRDGNL